MFLNGKIRGSRRIILALSAALLDASLQTAGRVPTSPTGRACVLQQNLGSCISVKMSGRMQPDFSREQAVRTASQPKRTTASRALLEYILLVFKDILALHLRYEGLEYPESL